MKKSINKKVLILSLVLIGLIALNFVIVAAEDAAATVDPNLSLFQRWVQSQMTNVDAKVILFLMIAIILYVLFYSLIGSNKGGLAFLLAIPSSIVLTIFVTPDSVLGILRSYNTLPLMIMAIFPLAILGAFTFFAIEKNKPALIKGQLAAWWIFLIFLVLRAIALWYNYVWQNPDPSDLFSIAINSFAGLPPAMQAGSFWAAFLCQLIIAGIMCFGGNTALTGIIGNSIDKTNQKIADRTVKKAAAGIGNAAKLEESLENGAGI